jgi:phenylacetate-coenzyme A ligase PaaK-like adenylate-forming protein
MHGYLLMPNPFKTNVMAGRAAEIYYDIVDDVKAAIDREINTELIRRSMLSATQKGIKASITNYAKDRIYKKMIKDIIKWLEIHHKRKTTIALVGAPFILLTVMKELRNQGKTFDFSDRGGVITGGGWKVHEQKRMPAEDFRKQVKEMLGINPEHCLDGYGMVEGNGWMIHCPEGHYFHIPHSYYHAMVLDEEFKPVGFNEYGRFAFLDGTTYSYPGFIITGDRVRMLKRCPVCDRPGPVFEPEVTRVAGKEMRGCAEEVRKMMSMDLGSD